MSGEGQDEEYLDFPGPAPGTEAVVKGYFLVYRTEKKTLIFGVIPLL